MNPHMCDENRHVVATRWVIESVLTNGAGATEYLHGKNETQHVLCTITQMIWDSIGLNVKDKAIKLYKERIEFLHNFEKAKDIFPFGNNTQMTGTKRNVLRNGTSEWKTSARYENK